MSQRYWAVVPAAGVGKRMQADRPKQYLVIQGKTILERSLRVLMTHANIEAVVCSISPGDEYWQDLPEDIHQQVILAQGGEERCHSVLNGLRELLKHADPHDWVLVHDAARPCLRHGDISRLMQALAHDSDGGILGLPVADTLKFCQNNHIEKTVDRSGLWRALTPQMFPLQHLHDALQQALERGELVTDEASCMELAGYHPRMVQGHADNIKITHPQDLQLASLYLQQMGAL